MRRRTFAAYLCLPILLTNCNIVPQRYQLAAQPLMPVPDTAALSDPGLSAATKAQISAFAGLDSKRKVHALVQDSQTKCAEFINSMFAQAAGSGVALDLLSTSASALATVFTPLGATHALSAASTIFSGTRSSITAEYLNSLTISHVAQAIQSTYTADIRKYITYLDAAESSRIDPYAERSTIVSYHNECSLAPAEGSISAALQPDAGPTAGYSPKPPQAASVKPSAAVLGQNPAAK